MAILGSILGDIACSKYEFKKPILIPNNLFEDDNKFTDDTILSLATKWIILKRGPAVRTKDFELAYYTFGSKYESNYGTLFEDWLNAEEKLPYNSFGNGSAMRVSYIGEYFENSKAVYKYAKMSAECTHNHPEGIKGAIVTAMLVFYAKTASKEQLLNYTKNFYPEVTKTLDEMRENYKWSDTCSGSIPLAFRCFYESTSYIDFIKKVLSFECDADTIATIGGGIAESFYKDLGFNPYVILKKYLPQELFDIAIA